MVKKIIMANVPRCLLLRVLFLCTGVSFTYGLLRSDRLECSATPVDGVRPFRVGQYVNLECNWVDLTPPSNFLSNASSVGSTVATRTVSPTTARGSTSSRADERPQLAWFRRENPEKLSELSASHEMLVKWRLAGDDFGIEFLCAATNGSEILYTTTCSLVPLKVVPEVTITSSPGEHHVGKSNTFKCDGQPASEIRTYEWFLNGRQKFPEHDDRFDGDSHIIVDDENDHRHRYLTFDRLNMTDNGTLITCEAWTVDNITSEASVLLIITEEVEDRTPWTKESVVLIACLTAGGAPVLFLIIVCVIWCISRTLKKRRRGYEIDYSGSFKSDDDVPAATEENGAPLQRRFQSNNAGSNSNHHGAGTTAAAIQRPNFFREKFNRFSQLFSAPTRYTDDESIYENTTPSLTTTFNEQSLSRGGSIPKGGSITRGGSLQLPHRPPLTKSGSTVSTPMSAPLCSSSLSRSRHVESDEQEYENFVPLKDYDNTPSALDGTTSPSW
ncbi:uncharacterized protein LOC129282450 [Lytechinus pictus]|uniref:uncharacterized protein LOC129282450 n=1 Tax=Lytechinus pictus TaxID=7653 RepID=UPI0030BA1733